MSHQGGLIKMRLPRRPRLSAGTPRSDIYCPTRGLGEKPTPLGEDFSMPEGQAKPQNTRLPAERHGY